ncbi:hypothetical protein BRADI_1g50650v3 [Brachypodium distachyon]|uniref:AAA+ ATPase domain-containing protein n=1 Tax=Brachypodium distachyon TaxID=15368 RepID=A0A0Q3K5J7_BRADI|nr:hypothetical protein BRADI_1g50650v3 [Brachypodium distachyon]
MFWARSSKQQPPVGSSYSQLAPLDATALDPVIGRDAEIDRVVCILCRRTKNCAALVGPAGVGKTAIVEALARRIAIEDAPAALAGARVLQLNVAAMVAGTKWRGMFEARLRSAIRRAEESAGKVILFVDEMHMLVGAGDNWDGTVDAANMLKPALARGRIRCVGVTTDEEYRKYIQPDAALERRFQKVAVEEPSVEATVAILRGLKQRYQDHHGVKIQEDALVAATHLAGRYITRRQFPDKAIDLIDKAIDLIDEACAGVKLHVEKQKQVEDEQNNSSINAPAGIVTTGHVSQDNDKLTGLPEKLQERVVGQDEAVNLVARAVLRSRVGICQSGQPIASFLFLGSVGVGKTKLAKALAEKLFDNKKMLRRFDMSEYAGSGSVSRLVGGPRRYEEEGLLTEEVRRYPYSVILFDEVDKADPSVFKVFIQLLDDGILSDGKGHDVDFKNTVIVMTSNLGADQQCLTSREAKENTKKDAHELLMKQVQRRLKPELVSRLSETVIFEPLSIANYGRS